MTETSIGGALKKAGFDTAANELRVAAVNLLNENKNDPAKILTGFVKKVQRRPELLGALALDYLKRVASDLGHAGAAAQKTNAENAAGGRAPAAAQPRHASSGSKSLTTKDKAINRAAMMRSVGLIYDRRKINGAPIGDLHWRELDAAISERVAVVGSTVLSTLQEAADALLMYKIRNFAQVPDADARVRDIVPVEVLEQFDREAREQAPAALNTAVVATVSSLQRYVESH
jgi:hypothetical protein